MALFDENELSKFNRQQINQVPDQPEEEPTTGTLDAIGSAFVRDNLIANIGKKAAEISTFGLRDEFDPNFDPFQHIEGYEDNATAFANANSMKDIEAIKTNIDYENYHLERLSKAPGWTQVVGGVAAGVADPLIFLPALKTAQMATRSARFAQGLGSGAAIGAGAGLARETALQDLQETRTLSESAFNILAESAFGGILGGAVGGLTSPVKAAGRNILAKAMRGEDYVININEKGVPTIDSAGAAAASNIEAEGLAHINENFAKMMAGPEFLRPISLRGVTSPSESLRTFTNNIWDHNYILNKNVEGIASGPKAQLDLNKDMANAFKNVDSIRNDYMAYAGIGKFKAATGLGIPEGKISMSDFNLRVTRALRDSSIVDEIAEVNKSVKTIRGEMDRLTAEMQELGIMPKDLDPVLSRNYLTRIYNLDQLAVPSVRKRFVNKVKNYVRTHHKDGSVRDKPIDDVEALQIADDITNTIRRQSDKQMSFNDLSEQLVSKGKFTKERILMINDNEIEEVLVSDATQLYLNFIRNASSIVNSTKALRRQGFDNFNQMLSQMVAEKDAAIRGLSDAQAAPIEKQFSKDIELAKDMYKAFLGQLRKPNKLTDTLANFQFVRLLGGVVLSSFPELVMPAFRLGLTNTLRDGYLPLLKSIKTFKGSREQLLDFDAGSELIQNNVLRSITDTDVNLGRTQTKFDRTMNLVVDTFGKASGITYFTAFGRQMGAHVAMADIIRTMRSVADGTKLKQGKIEELASIGIGKNDYEAIISQLKHTEEINGSFFANLDQWDNAAAKDKFIRAVQTQVESVILKPSAGDQPVFAQKSNIGRLVFQFKNFASAATGKISISALQRRDARTLTGLLMLVGMGSMSRAVKDAIAGREQEDIDTLLAEGVANSGVLGLMGTTLLDFGLSVANDKSRRYAGSGLASQILGPNFGQVYELGKVVNRLADGKVSESDRKAILRMLPFMNLFYVTFLMNKAFKN